MRLKRRLKGTLIFLTIFTLIITVLFIFLFERFGVPVGRQLARERIVTMINRSINNAVKQTAQEQGITADNLYTAHFNDKGQLSYLEVNSLLINSICADTARILSEDMNSMGGSAVYLPLGTITGINLLSHSGPKIPLYLTPSGSAVADYETTMESAGIGQVNFKVWLVTETEVGIVNPLMQGRIKVTRKLMLVNTVFSGEVPEAFYGERSADK